MKHNLIFLHIPKNGGSTFHFIVKRYFKEQNIFSIKILNNTTTNTKELLEMPKYEKDQVKLLTGHMKFGLHKELTGESKYITFLREPEERVISFYYYILRKPNHRLYKTVTENNMSLYDFVTKIDSHDVNNGQIRLLSGIDDTEENMLAKALENIENHFSFVGLTEKYDESLILLKKMYNWSTPYYKTVNKTKNRTKFEELDSKTIKALQEYNKGDRLLYDKIKKELENKIYNLSDMESQLRILKLKNRLFYSVLGEIIRRIYKKLK